MSLPLSEQNVVSYPNTGLGSNSNNIPQVSSLAASEQGNPLSENAQAEQPPSPPYSAQETDESIRNHAANQEQSATNVNSYLDSLDHSSDIFVNNRITFLELPELEKPLERSSRCFIENVVEGYCPIIKQIIQEKVSETDRSACRIIVDVFYTGIIDVANDLNVPAYLLYTSSASSLALLLHFQDLQHNKGVDLTELGGLDTELDILGFKKLVLSWAVPTVLLDKSVDNSSVGILNQVKRYREAKGIIANTFTAVKSSVIPALSQDPDVPTVYDVGPIVNLNPMSGGDERNS
ncbi:hypothetical protein Droror1_Dr00011073 [Drosera rotundifolia]